MKKFNIKKVELVKPVKSHKRVRMFVSSVITFIIALFLFSSIYGVVTFFDTYGLQSPLVLRSPIYRLHPEILVSPVSTKSAVQGTFDLGKIADYIYMKESSSGVNDGCRDLGLYNGYGFRQNTSEWVCYKSHEEVRSLVINWLTKNVKDGNVEKALCLYNQGLDEQSCTYTVAYK